MNEDLPKLKVTERIAGNANNILQPRFHSTEGKKGRPKKAPIKRPTADDIKKLLRLVYIRITYSLSQHTSDTAFFLIRLLLPYLSKL